MERYKPLFEASLGNYSNSHFLFYDKKGFDKAVKLMNDNDLIHRVEKWNKKDIEDMGIIEDYIAVSYNKIAKPAMKLFDKAGIKYKWIT